MQKQFDRFKQELADVVRSELRSTERTLGDQLERALSSAQTAVGDQLERELASAQTAVGEQFKRELTSAQTALGEQFKRELTSAERRLSTQYQTQVETVRTEVRLAAEAFGGTLDGINRGIQALEENVGATLKDHAKVLSTHSRQIDELNRRSGH